MAEGYYDADEYLNRMQAISESVKSITAASQNIKALMDDMNAKDAQPDVHNFHFLNAPTSPPTLSPEQVREYLDPNMDFKDQIEKLDKMQESILNMTHAKPFATSEEEFADMPREPYSIEFRRGRTMLSMFNSPKVGRLLDYYTDVSMHMSSLESNAVFQSMSDEEKQQHYDKFQTSLDKKYGANEMKALLEDNDVKLFINMTNQFAVFPASVRLDIFKSMKAMNADVMYGDNKSSEETIMSFDNLWTQFTDNVSSLVNYANDGNMPDDVYDKVRQLSKQSLESDFLQRTVNNGIFEVSGMPSSDVDAYRDAHHQSGPDCAAHNVSDWLSDEIKTQFDENASKLIACAKENCPNNRYDGLDDNIKEMIEKIQTTTEFCSYMP